MFVVLITMIAYGLLHSLLASKEVKRAYSRRFGERAFHGTYRLVFNVIAVVAFLPITWLVVFAENAVVWSFDAALEPLLLAIQAAGLLGFLVSLVQIDVIRFAGLTQLLAWLGSRPLPLPPEPLSTGGVYRLVRHPLYLFSLMILWPVMSMTDTYLGFSIGATLYFLIGSVYEERRMLEHFGDDYRNYRRQVPWLIPFLRFANKS